MEIHIGLPPSSVVKFDIWAKEAKLHLALYCLAKPSRVVSRVLEESLIVSGNVLSSTFFTRICHYCLEYICSLCAIQSIQCLIHADTRLILSTKVLNRIGIYFAGTAAEDRSLAEIVEYIVGPDKLKKTLRILPSTVVEALDLQKFFFAFIATGKNEHIARYVIKNCDVTVKIREKHNRIDQKLIRNFFAAIVSGKGIQQGEASEALKGALVSEREKNRLLHEENEILRLDLRKLECEDDSDSSLANCPPVPSYSTADDSRSQETEVSITKKLVEPRLLKPPPPPPIILDPAPLPPLTFLAAPAPPPIVYDQPPPPFFYDQSAAPPRDYTQYDYNAFYRSECTRTTTESVYHSRYTPY